MQKLYQFVGLAALVTLTATALGCNGVITFTIDEESGEQTVEGSSNPLDSFIPFDSPFSFNVNLEQQLEKRDAKGAKEVRLETLDLVVTDTEMQGDDTDNFDFLDSITFYVDADGLERRKLAWRDSVPEGKQRLSMQVDDSIDLKPYVEKGMTLETDAEASPPEDDTSIKGEITIWVKAL